MKFMTMVIYVDDIAILYGNVIECHVPYNNKTISVTVTKYCSRSSV